MEKQYLQREIKIMKCFTNVVKFIIECTWEETKKEENDAEFFHL